MTEPDTRMASAIAAAQAALDADEIVREWPPGTPARRERMRQIIHATALAWSVERVDLTIALSQRLARRG